VGVTVIDVVLLLLGIESLKLQKESPRVVAVGKVTATVPENRY
jgi:hypothetical protein